MALLGQFSFREPCDTVAQLTAILEVAPAADLVDAVFVRSEGNPFFTEELLAAVQAGSGALPATVRDLLGGRVQRLSEQTSCLPPSPV